MKKKTQNPPLPHQTRFSRLLRLVMSGAGSKTQRASETKALGGVMAAGFGITRI
jgi:hypothetical protein